MKIETQYVATQSLEKFADEHDLTMVVTERPDPAAESMRYYACFRHSEIKIGCILEGMIGNAAIPDTAIKNYASAISGRMLVIDAMSPKLRREIQLPRLIG